MASSEAKAQPIETKDQLIDDLEKGCKDKDLWRIGTEHEKFPFYKHDLSPVPYEGEKGIGAFLQEMQRRHQFEPIMEKDNIIGLIESTEDRDIKANVSLEPGGQFELSGAPLRTIHQTCNEVNRHLIQVRSIGEDLGIGFLGLGFNPLHSLEAIPQMPKGRYKIMTDYMPKVGAHGLDMMYRTATVQVNLDFASEADMVKKFRVSMALQPIATALFANSVFKDGKLNGYQSYRSQVWLDVDKDRSGILPFIFEDGMGFERYVDYALDVPLYFIYRDGTYIPGEGHTFRDFFEGKFTPLNGEQPNKEDWENHLTTLFPEVRLKQFLEMRGADGGPWRNLCALPALWTGLLYDTPAIDAAYDLIKDWEASEHQFLRNETPKTGLHTTFRQGTLFDIAAQVLSIAESGLKSRNQLDYLGQDETHHLAPLQQILADGRSTADELIDKFTNQWQGDMKPLYQEMVY